MSPFGKGENLPHSVGDVTPNQRQYTVEVVADTPEVMSEVK